MLYPLLWRSAPSHHVSKSARSPSPYAQLRSRRDSNSRRSEVNLARKGPTNAVPPGLTNPIGNVAETSRQPQFGRRGGPLRISPERVRLAGPAFYEGRVAPRSSPQRALAATS